MSFLSPNPAADWLNASWADLVVNQPFNVTDAMGSAETLSFAILDASQSPINKTLIIAGVSIGMNASLIAVLLLLSAPSRRGTPVFIINLICLFLMFLRMLFTTIQYNGSACNISSGFLSVNVLITPGAIAVAFFYAITTILWYGAIFVSLMLQVRVVFSAERRLQNFVTVVLAIPALATFAMESALQITYMIRATTKFVTLQPSWVIPLDTKAYTIWGATTGVASLIFVCKLVYLIHKRKQMGIKRFGPLQIFTIMGTQCLIVPRRIPNSSCRIH
jgi:pheromone alpha factor receptor